MLVSNWKEVLLKSWAIWVAAIGLALPELLEFLANNSDTLPLTDEWKSTVRTVALALVIVARVVQQKSLSGPTTPKE